MLGLNQASDSQYLLEPESLTFSHCAAESPVETGMRVRVKIIFHLIGIFGRIYEQVCVSHL
jgi:hypothetical protein